MPKQFFLPEGGLSGERFRLEGPEAFHALKVLRLREGQELELFDGRGTRLRGVIESVHADGWLEGRVLAREAAAAARRRELRLYAGLLRAGPWELVLEKATELGAAAIIPVYTPRSVVVLREAERAKSKAERWSRLLTAAAKQCGRPDLPALEEPAAFRDAVKACEGRGLTLLAWEGLRGAAAGRVLRQALAEAAAPRVNLFIGPEGGFSEEEVELAQSLGAVVFGLGPRVLRAETASLAALSVLQYELGEL